MSIRWLAAAAALAAAQAAVAQPMNGCPEGQAIQASDPSGKHVRCIPVPPPVDVSGLQAQINAEAAARQGMDATLLGAIDQLRADAIEASIVGTYTFTGTQSCLTASLGFNPDLTPVQPPPPPPGQPFVPNQVSTSASAVWGYRTFNADGTGSAEFHSQNLGGESLLFSSFAWEIASGKLFITEGQAQGTITRGGPRVGWTVISQNVPRTMGVLGKDLRIISLVHEEINPEIGITRSPDGTQEFISHRICYRERTLRKM